MENHGAKLHGDLARWLRTTLCGQPPPQERIALEKKIEAFKQRPDAMSLAFVFLRKSKDEYVQWFSASIVENIVNKRWHSLSPEIRERFRKGVYALLLEQAKVDSSSEQTKVAAVVIPKLLVSLARIALRDWPQQYPDFFSQLEKLLEGGQGKASQCMGLHLLVVVLEEFPLGPDGTQGAVSENKSGERCPVLCQRRKQIHDCITKRIGHLTKTLGYLLANELRTLRPDLATAQANRAVVLALKALALLVRVESASFAELLHRALLGPLFGIIRMGHTRTMATPGALAVTVLTEFISRACVPPNQKLFFLAVTKNLLGVIHGVLKAGGGSLSGVESEFLGQLNVFLACFLRMHIKRIEPSPHTALSQTPKESASIDFPAFLKLVFTYTFQQPDADGLKHMWGVWLSLANGLCTTEQRSEPTSQRIKLYHGAFSEVLKQTIRRVLFFSNAGMLRQLDDDQVRGEKTDAASDGLFGSMTVRDGVWVLQPSAGRHDKGNSELEQFISSGTEVVTAMVQIPTLASVLLQGILPMLKRTYGLAMQALEKTERANASGHEAGDAVAKNTIETVHDLTTLLRLFCCVTKLLVVTGSNSEIQADPKMFQTARQMLSAVLKLASFAAQHRLYRNGSSFQNIQIVTLQCLRQLVPWLSSAQRVAQARGQAEMMTFFTQATERIAQVVATSLNCSIVSPPEEILVCAANLFTNYIRTSQVAFVWRSPTIKTMLEPPDRPAAAGAHSWSLGPRWLSVLPLSVQAHLFTAMVFFMSLPIKAKVAAAATAKTKPDCHRETEALRSSALIRDVVGTIVDLSTTARENVSSVTAVQLSRPQHVRTVCRSCFLVGHLCSQVDSMGLSSVKASLATAVVGPCVGACMELLRVHMRLLVTWRAQMQHKPTARFCTKAALKRVCKCIRELLCLSLLAYRSMLRHLGASNLCTSRKEGLKTLLRMHVGGVTTDAVKIMLAASPSVLVAWLALISALLDRNTTTGKQKNLIVQDCLRICVADIWPFLRSGANLRDHPDLTHAFYTTLTQMVRFQYRFFVKTSKIPNPETGLRERRFTSPANQKAFSHIMSIFLHALGGGPASASPDVVRCVADGILVWNQHHHLLSLPLFQREMLFVFVRTLLCSIYKGSYALIGDKLGSLLWNLYRHCPRGLFEDKCLSAFMAEVFKASASKGGKSVDMTHGKRVLDHHRRVFGAHYLVPGNAQGPLDNTAFDTAMSDLVNDCRFLCSN